MKKLILSLLTLASLTACKKDIVEPVVDSNYLSDTNNLPRKVVTKISNSSYFDNTVTVYYEIILFNYNNKHLLTKSIKYDSLKSNQKIEIKKYYYNSSSELSKIEYFDSTTTGEISLVSDWKQGESVIPLPKVKTIEDVNFDSICSRATSLQYYTGKLTYFKYYDKDGILDYVLFKNDKGDVIDSTDVFLEFYKNRNDITVNDTVYRFSTWYQKNGELLIDGQEPVYQLNGYRHWDGPYFSCVFDKQGALSSYDVVKASSLKCNLRPEIANNFLSISSKNNEKYFNLEINHVTGSNGNYNPNGTSGDTSDNFEYYFDNKIKLVSVVKHHKSYDRYTSKITSLSTIIY